MKRILIFGNSGSGKSTLARRLAEEHGLVLLDLDTIVWVPGQIAVARDHAEVFADLHAFADAHPGGWILEGCYGDLIEHALPMCSELIFMNPGEARCLAHNRARPWEPHKYASKEKQDAMLPFLQAWVSQYYTREDPCSYAWHRRVYEQFHGNKRELN